MAEGFTLSTIEVGIRIGSAFLCGLVDDIHRSQLQRRRMPGVNVGSLDELDLGLTRHRILQGLGDRDVANSHRTYGYPPGSGLLTDVIFQLFVGLFAVG